MKFSLVLLASASVSAFAQITVDGLRSEVEYTSLTTQTTVTGWGNGNVLANLSAAQIGATLHLHIGGRANGNAIILFLDTKPGGLSLVPNNAVLSGGEANTLNNFGTSTTSGMNFEIGFSPDYVVRVYGTGADAYVNTYNLTTGVRAYAGNAGSASITSGFVSSLRASWADVASTEYAAASKGVEMALNLTSLGVPNGSQDIKFMALLVNGESNYGSNQVLSSRNTSGDMASGMSTINWETEAGTQTLAFRVSNEDSDGDSLPDSIDPDDDNDTLLDTSETNTGSYVSSTNTGTDPKAPDSDDDGYRDDAELSGVLGYASDPNIPNYVNMAVPGDYTAPTWKEDGSAGNRMTQVGTGPTTQYTWQLSYHFTVPRQAINYKYAANLNWTKNWGSGAAANSMEAGGGNLQSTISASGFHSFLLDTRLLTQTLTRQVFLTVTDFLTAYGLAADPTGDADQDGVSNQAEFTANTDPTAADTDGDTIPDNTDAAPLVFASAYDAWAASHALTGPNAARTADPDGDRHDNNSEFLFGTNPTVGNSVFINISSQGNANTLTWLQRTAGATYTLEETDSLQEAWAPNVDSPEPAVDQSGLPAGYTRYLAPFNAAGGKMFARIKASEL